MGRTGVALLLVILLLVHPVSNMSLLEDNSVNYAARNSGVDLSATDVSIRYSNPSDESQFKMFSSNHPILGFDRPKSLYAVDSVNSTPMDIEVTVRNDGNTPSGIITLQLLILHDEYQRFELANRTITMNSLNAGEQGTMTFYNVYVNYSGNHTLRVLPSFQGVDDNPSNDVLNRHYTVAKVYFTCTSLVGWNAGQYWGTSTDTALSMGQSCHIGQGQSGSYPNNLQTDLMTPVWDMDDIVGSPSRTNGISFYYAGSANQNDGMKVYAFNEQGGWDELANIAGAAGSSLSNWRTISNNHMGHITPLIPADPASHFHANSRFKFSFSSDASGTDVGYWLDDFILVYDQSARTEEYNLDVTGIFTDGSIPGAWGKIRMELTNTGNISDVLVPSVANLPQDWNVAYSFPSGAGVNLNAGIQLLPGESKQIDIRIQPDLNSSVGFVPLTFEANSLQNPSFSVVEPMQFQVSADRIPHIHIPEVKPKCAPGSTCAFSIEVENIGQATDVFDLQTAPKSLENGWNVNLAFDQLSSIRLVPNQIQSVKFVMTVPVEAIPDKTGDFWLTLTAQNDTSRTIREAISIQASMISDALVVLDQDSSEVSMLGSGERIEIKYEITNRASRQDSFELTVDFVEKIGWAVEAEQRPAIVVNPGATVSFYVAVTAPNNAQANDRAPEFRPVLTSLRSGMQYDGPTYDEIIIETIYDVGLQIVSSSSLLLPGDATIISIQLTNHGNGPTSVFIGLDDVPSSWTYSVRKGGLVLDNPIIDLGVSYDGQEEEVVEVLLSVPVNEAGGEIHTITITASPDGTDIQPSDNHESIDMITQRVNYPELNVSTLDYYGKVGSTVGINGSVKNVGNFMESSMDVGFELSSSPPSTDIVAFMTVGEGGAVSGSGEMVTFPMAAGEESMLNIDVILGENVALNTRIVVTLYAEGGLDSDGNTIRLESQNLIIVDQQRKVGMQLSNHENQTYLDVAEMWLNLSSSSTQNEIVYTRFAYPENWQVMCDSMLIANNESIETSLPYSRSLDTISDVRCEVQRISGSYRGEIFINASTADEEFTYSASRSITFERVEGEKGFFLDAVNGPTIIASAFGVMILFVILLLVRKQRKTQLEDAPSVSGPPISTQTTIKTGPELEQTKPLTEQPEIQQPPPIPEEGLPPGWSVEQWNYYGQEYLDRRAKHP